MYMQGNPGDGFNGGEQDAAWSTRPPRMEPSGNQRRRRSKSAKPAEPAMDAQTVNAAEQAARPAHAPAGAQQTRSPFARPAEQPGYSGGGYAPRNGYGAYPQNGYAPDAYADQNAYPQQGGYAQRKPFSDQPGYADPNGYADPTGYPRQGVYPDQGGYAPQPGYANQPGYAEPNTYAPQNGYANQPGYADPTGYAPQNGYADPTGYTQRNAYADQSGYAPQNGYADPTGYTQRNAYTDQGGYPPQGAYADQSAYPPQNGYADPNAYPDQGGYSDPNSYNDEPAYDPAAYPASQAHYNTSTYRSGYVPPAGDNYGMPSDDEYLDSPSDKVDALKDFLRKNAAQAIMLLLFLGALAAWAAFGNGGSNTPPVNDRPGASTTAQPAAQTGSNTGKGNASAYVGLFLPNVYVDGICLADMTYEEGSNAVWAQVNQKQNSWYVRLKNENGSTKDITASMLGISFDPSQALQQAWAIGHPLTADGKVDQKALQQAVSDALATEYHFTSAQQSADTTPIDTILATLQTNAYRAPQDAVILSFNPDDFVNPFTFQEESWGQWLDVSAVKEQILELVSTMQSGEVLLQTTPIAPNVTVSDLQKTVTLRCRAVTPISSSSTEDRTNNIRVAMAKINGKSLAHGDRFSFNKLVGRRTIENGFFEAIEYAYGEEVMGVGGGVCQASTTVYLAAVQSGMTITSRDAHSNPVNYTSLGMDATVSDTRGREVDFAFKNESGGRIFIAAHVVESGSNGRSLLCEVRIYGPSLENVYYKLESETVEIIPKPELPKLKDDKTGERAYYTDETKLASKGREGYVVDTYLCTYQDDVLIGRDKISTDTYPAREDVYWVGIHSR
ncbi:MAG: hypothetical protein E7320_11475 [Clostridiales bacterium]|nr:hypothetical protein [Clostridiales bacterium]